MLDPRATPEAWNWIVRREAKLRSGLEGEELFEWNELVNSEVSEWKNENFTRKRIEMGKSFGKLAEECSRHNVSIVPPQSLTNWISRDKIRECVETSKKQEAAKEEALLNTSNDSSNLLGYLYDFVEKEREKHQADEMRAKEKKFTKRLQEKLMLYRKEEAKAAEEKAAAIWKTRTEENWQRFINNEDYRLNEKRFCIEQRRQRLDILIKQKRDSKLRKLARQQAVT